MVDYKRAFATCSLAVAGAIALPGCGSLNQVGRTLQTGEAATAQADTPCTKIGVVYEDNGYTRAQLFNNNSGYGYNNYNYNSAYWGRSYVAVNNNVVVPIRSINGVNHLIEIDGKKSEYGRGVGMILGALIGSRLGGHGIGAVAGAAGGGVLGNQIDRGANAAAVQETQACMQWIKAGGNDYITPIRPAPGQVLVPEGRPQGRPVYQAPARVYDPYSR